MIEKVKGSQCPKCSVFIEIPANAKTFKCPYCDAMLEVAETENGKTLIEKGET